MTEVFEKNLEVGAAGGGGNVFGVEVILHATAVLLLLDKRERWALKRRSNGDLVIVGKTRGLKEVERGLRQRRQELLANKRCVRCSTSKDQ